MMELLDPETWRQMGLLDGWMLVALGSVALGGFLRGFTGFGGALIIVPVLSVIFSPREAVPMHSILELPGLFQLIPIAILHAHRPTVVPMILTLLVALPVGVFLLVSIDQDIMRVVISVVVLMMVALVSTNWRYRASGRPFIPVAAGAAGGLIHGSAGVGGPPMVAVMLARGDPPETTRANIIAMTCSLIVVGLPIMWLYGLLTPRVILVGAISAPIYFATIYLGSNYFAGNGKKIYRNASLVMLALIALATLVAALLK